MIICPNLSNKEVAQEFNELKSALEAADPKHGEAMAYLVWSLNNGNAIDKAPNGAESLLFKSLVDYYEGDRSKAIVAKAKTYSTNFLKWFGNWTGEKDALPEYERSEVSKVVDENGEPLVVFHHTDDDNLEEFSLNFKNYFQKDGGTNKAFFFDENTTGTLNRKYDIPVFLDIKILHEYTGTKEDLHNSGTTYRKVVNDSAEKNPDYGGVHMKDFDDNKLEHQSVWITHNPNLIKAVDNRGGEYTGSNIYLLENTVNIGNVDKLYILSYNNELKLQETKDFNPFSYFKDRNYSVLCKKTSKAFENYCTKVRYYNAKDKLYGFPSLFFDNVTGLLYIKSNSYKNSRKYDVVDSRTGEYIKYGVTLFTYDEFEESHYKISKKERSVPKTFSPARSVNFALLRQLPSKNRYKTIAKQFIYDAVDPRENTVNFKIIDDFVDSMPDALWDYISSDVYGFNEDIYVGPSIAYSTDTSGITAATSKINSLDLLINIPKLGLIKFAELITGIKLLGRRTKFNAHGKKLPNKNRKFGESVILDNNLTRPEIEYLIEKILTEEYFKTSTTLENIEHYAKHKGVSVEQVLKEMELNREYDDIYSSKANEFIRNYNWLLIEFKHNLEAKWNKTVSDYITSKYKDKFTKNDISFIDQYFKGILPWIKIEFNLDSGQSEYADNIAEPFVRLASVIHEPFHALHALSYGSIEELLLRNAYDLLINTEFGKKLYSLVKNSLSLNVTEDGIYKETCAYVFLLINTPNELIDVMGDQFLSSKIYHLIKDVLELPIETEVRKTLLVTTSVEIQERDIKLNFILKARNFLVSALHKILPITKKYVELINSTIRTEKEVLVSSEVETSVETERSKLAQSNKADFLNKLDRFETAIKVLQNIDNTVLSSANISKFFNTGTSNPDDANIYHNEGEFDSWNEEQQKYYRWLPGAKQRLASASAANIELVKADIRNEFNGFGFKHFTLSIKKNDYDGWYIRIKNRNDQKDIKDLRKIAKTIGYTELSVHELSGEQAENLMKYLFSEVHGTSEHMNNIVSILKSALKDKNIKIQFVRNTVEDSPAHYNHETGVITVNINGAFKNSNGYDNIAAQTVLHELIHAVTVETIKHSPELHKELENLFNKVKHSARALYSGLYIYGLTDIYEFIAELSNEDFVRMLQGIHTASERKLLISTIIDFMRKVINKILTIINKKWQGTAYADAMELLMKAAFPQDFDIKQHSEPQDEQTLFNAISARQQSAEDEANRIITRMNVLYTQYEKMKDKTPSQQRIANRIFETLNKLKQHRDITAVQIALDLAKLTLGQRNLSSNEPARLDGNGNPIANNVYMYLYDSSLTDFSGVSAQSLVDMYRNSIKFYSDLIDNIPSEHTIDLTNEDKKQIEELSSLIKYSIMPLWTRAIMTVGDRIVEDQIDLEVSSSEENKEDMKKVAKDWLHKNLMYGDINVVTSYIYNNSYSSNPIIKQAFHLIQGAEQKTLEEMHQIAPELIKAYQKANVGLRAVTPGWQSMMMEYDEKGIPTGNFVTEVNFGQYQKDLKEFLEDLNDEFIEDYGFTYVVDDTGAVTNSLTGEFAEDEEWGPDGEPPVYIQYLTRIELWKADRVHRRYLPDYYMERISRPYDGTIDPLSPEFKDTRFNHGLSPRTLSKYTYYQSNINFYLNKCQDEITGLVYPERLSYDDLLSLDRFKSEMEQFTQLFNPDGSYKTGEDLKMAYEVRAWLKFTGEHNNPTVNQDSFNNELAKVKQESIEKNNPRIYNDFIRYNSHIGINPDYVLQTVGDFKLTRLDTDTSFRGRLMRASLQAMVNNPRIFDKELQKMVNNPLFWLLCKMADLAIEDSRDPTNPSGWDKEKVEKYNENFYQRDILYIDEYGFYIDRDGNKINPQNPKAKELEESGKLLTFRQWLINKYTDEALRTGTVTGLIDESTGQPIDFGGLSKNEIHHQISILLSFRQKTWGEDGTVSEEYVPLSIFTTLSPKTETFFNSRTKRTEPTVIVVGDNRFKEYNSTLLDTDYNPKSGIAEIPNIKYADGRYDNIVAYMNVMRDDNVKELYDLLINTMQDALSIYSTNRKFNYKIPQINARTVALFSRIIKRGYTTKSLQAIWDSMSSIEENDELLRTKQDYFVGVDGEVANDVPLKFIKELKNKEDLSTDLVSSVIFFADMALNYKNKMEIDSKLRILRYNMDSDIRDVYESRLKPEQEQYANENEQSAKMFDSMMDTSMYGNRFEKTTSGGPSKKTVVAHKTADMFQRLESSAMLGFNMFSMAVGFGDSVTRIFSESVAGKYMTVEDCVWAFGKCLYYTPACIKNMFNPLANNKMTALMQMNGISKDTFATYTKVDWGKGRKFLGNVLMGGWSMLDWMANALLMMAFYHNCRFFEGVIENGTQIIKPGFYTKYELQQAFINAGKTKAEANRIHHGWGDIFDSTEYKTLDKDGNVVKKKFRGRITLWDAYQFAPYYKDELGHIKKAHGRVVVLDEYAPFVTQRVKTNIATKTKKRGAIYNGMNPDNDTPMWKRDILGRLAGALRSWILQQVQHLFAGGTDNIEVTFSKVQTPEVKGASTKMKTRYVKNKLTDELLHRRMSWDYETGTPQDQIAVGLWRSFNTMYKMSVQTLLHKPKTAKLSEVEKYAWKDTIIFLAMLSMMMVGWVFVHDDAREVKKPTNRIEAGPASMLNPVDYYDFIQNVYIPNLYWKLGVDNVYFRITESKVSNISPQQVLDIVNALTALKSGLDDQIGVIGLATDAINGENTDEVLKQGAYKFYTKGERQLYRAVGPAKNLHTFLTYYGATNNLRWYTNKFGKFYRAFGYDFKALDTLKPKQKQLDILRGDITRGDITRGGDILR